MENQFELAWVIYVIWMYDELFKRIHFCKTVFPVVKTEAILMNPAERLHSSMPLRWKSSSCEIRSGHDVAR